MANYRHLHEKGLILGVREPYWPEAGPLESQKSVAGPELGALLHGTAEALVDA